MLGDAWRLHGAWRDNRQAAARELLEETGLVASELMLGVFSGKHMRHTYPHGDQIEVVQVVYTCDDFIGELRPQTEEGQMLKWFDIDALPEDITPCDRPALAAFWRR